MKTILITGSTDGIGKLAALQLAKAGHQILVHGRNPEKVKATIAEMQTQSTQTTYGYVADLSSLSGVESLVTQIQNDFSQIDVLINNAGIFKSPTDLTSKGMDIRFAVNYMAPFHLTQGLLPLLQKSEEPRIINLSSAAQAPVSIAALEGKETMNSQMAYAQSKLALTMWSFWMAQQHPNLNVIAVNPGSLLQTKMVKEAYGQFWSSAEKGAQILRKLATEERFKHDSGKYFDNDQGHFAPAHSDAYQTELISQLITRTNALKNF